MEIRAESISYVYPNSKTPALDSVDFSADKGRRTAIIGENGCGKSTLSYCLNGVFKPKSGTVFYRDEPISYDRTALESLRNEVVLLLQNPDDQIFSFTVEEDVAFGPMNAGMNTEEADCRVGEALECIGMSDYREVPIHRLSYGQRKKVAFAGALALRPEVLIMDEPTSGLDPQMSRELMEIADVLTKSGTTVILSTHDVDLIYPWTDDLCVMRRGRTVFHGEPHIFFGNSAELCLSGLVRPSAFIIGSELCPNGDSDPYVPKTASQMISRLRPPASVGTVYMHSTDGGDVDQAALEDAIGKKGITTAIYGPAARRSAVRCGIRVDFYFNGADRCMEEAACGRDSLLIYDEGSRSVIDDLLSAMRFFGADIRIAEVSL